jgi:hypothetical protein
MTRSIGITSAMGAIIGISLKASDRVYCPDAVRALSASGFFSNCQHRHHVLSAVERLPGIDGEA